MCAEEAGLTLHCFLFSFSTYCGVVGGDIEQNLGGASAGDVSVAVPHTGDQVGLTPDGERRRTQIRNANQVAR